MSWEEARLNCVEQGSHLVVITSDEVTDFIMNQIGKNDKHHWWIGLNAFKKEGAKWVDGTHLVYDNFHPGQPTGESFEGCTEMFTPHNGEWHDRRCTAPGRSICQRIDLCGHTCWDVVGNRGESCSCTWAEGCGTHDIAPPASFSDKSSLFDLCPNECRDQDKRPCITVPISSAQRKEITLVGFILTLVLWV